MCASLIASLLIKCGLRCNALIHTRRRFTQQHSNGAVLALHGNLSRLLHGCRGRLLAPFGFRLQIGDGLVLLLERRS
ncbi:hypothetical protein XFUD_10080 [Xylella fastidiosa]|nr:hypothetical protein XFUD_10080 [Xylella fastidiosa]ETE34214.1 hypothetical protein B398_03430 [Xylella fastidiosa 32]OCA57301.1 hypothetical protein AA93_09880 [Xylella fastidiosa subsp. pauca 11399]OJZ71798.1 hypothetical protein B375_0203425 [Xylella fastidiosa 6c]ALR01451.1 hypothetical protein OY18_03480 [Xylella fastidiosa]